MVAVDTSSLIAFLRGDEGRDVEALGEALERSQAVLPPVVVTELLSEPNLDTRVARLVRGFPVLEILPGYWARAGVTRAKVLRKRLRARLADTLISQSCIDHRVPLITRDSDFRHFEKHAALELV
jgi:predicted nucleic acid-binding protein